MTDIEKKVVTTYIIPEADFKAKLGIQGRISGNIVRFWNSTEGGRICITTEADLKS